MATRKIDLNWLDEALSSAITNARQADFCYRKKLRGFLVNCLSSYRLNIARSFKRNAVLTPFGINGFAAIRVLNLRALVVSRAWSCKVFLLVLAVLLGCPPSAMADQDSADIAALCDSAAVQASRETGVPISVLRAITLTETGRSRNGNFRPWPWTVNMEGAGVWFDNADEAKAYVFRHHARGARSFDVGCFQLNFRWHGQGFSSIEEMFQPLANARYAAGFLSDLYSEMGDWSKAAGAYHSRTPRYANRYRARFDRIRARIDGEPPPETTVSEAEIAAATQAELPEDPAPPTEEPAVRVNTFPLLQANVQPSGLGSLVPLGNAPQRGLFDQEAATMETDDAG